MKKLIVFLTALEVASFCNAQKLDEIINRYYVANGLEALEKASTVYVSAKVSQMGMDIPMVINAKKPNKVKMSMTVQGMEIVTVFDGQKGYIINPMSGSSEPVEIPSGQLESVQEYNLLRNRFMDAFREGRVKLEGEDTVGDKPAFKLLITNKDGNVITNYLDKETLLVVKTVQKVNQMGQEMEVESYIKGYMDVSGIRFPKSMIQTVNGMELGSVTFEKIELDKPVDDSLFIIK